MSVASIWVEEPAVHNVVIAMLARCGFVVNELPVCVKPQSPEECDSECCSNAAAPQLIVLEVITHRACNGVETAWKLLRRWPAVKILLTSASPVEMWPDGAGDLAAQLPRESVAFLPKPFSFGQFETTVKRLVPHSAVPSQSPGA